MHKYFGSCKILQARILELVAVPFSRQILYQLSHQGSPCVYRHMWACQGAFHLLTQDSNRGLLHCRQIVYLLSYQGGLYIWAYLHHTNCIFSHQFSSVRFSHLVVSDSLRPHESQHARPPCPSSTPRVHSDSRPSSQ